MKKILLLAALIAVFGCTKDETTQETTPEGGAINGSGKYITSVKVANNAGFVQLAPLAPVAESNSLSWKEGDRVLFYQIDKRGNYTGYVSVFALKDAATNLFEAVAEDKGMETNYSYVCVRGIPTALTSLKISEDYKNLFYTIPQGESDQPLEDNILLISEKFTVGRDDTAVSGVEFVTNDYTIFDLQIDANGHDIASVSLSSDDNVFVSVVGYDTNGAFSVGKSTLSNRQSFDVASNPGSAVKIKVLSHWNKLVTSTTLNLTITSPPSKGQIKSYRRAITLTQEDINKFFGSQQIAIPATVAGSGADAADLIPFEIPVWDGTASSTPKTETGADAAADNSQQTVYISTANELAWISEKSNANSATFQKTTFIQTNDIDLGGYPFTSIKKFSGIYDGDGLKIMNYKPLLVSGTNCGLVGVLEAGLVKNLTVENSAELIDLSSTSCSAFGVIAGQVTTGGSVQGCTTKCNFKLGAGTASGVVGQVYQGTAGGNYCAPDRRNMWIKDNKSYTNLQGAGSTAGIVGSVTVGSTTTNLDWTTPAYISANINYGALQSSAYKVGGIVADINFSQPTNANGISLIIENCENRGAISATGNILISGIVAEISNGNNITNADGLAAPYNKVLLKECNNYGSITSIHANLGAIVSKVTKAQGEESVVIDNCANFSANVTTSASNAYIGNVCGLLTGGTIQNCTNTTSLENRTTSGLGGILGTNAAGLSQSKVINCHNTGVITGKASVGGVVARFIAAANEDLIISKCSNSGEVYGTASGAFIGGVVGTTLGVVSGKITISDCINRDGAIVQIKNVTSASGNSAAGGVIGNLSNDDCTYRVINCINEADMICDTRTITGSNFGTSGVIGMSLGKSDVLIKGCVNRNCTIDVSKVTLATTSSNVVVSGVVNCAAGTPIIANCINSNVVFKVAAEELVAEGKYRLGGILGSASTPPMYACYVANTTIELGARVDKKTMFPFASVINTASQNNFVDDATATQVSVTAFGPSNWPSASLEGWGDTAPTNWDANKYGSWASSWDTYGSYDAQNPVYPTLKSN